MEAPQFAGRSLEEVPAGELQRGLAALPPAARARALTALAGRPRADADSLRVSSGGALFYVCARAPDHGVLTQAPASTATAAATSRQVRTTSPTPPVLHSKAGLTNIIYLDFDGGVVSGTAWNTNSQSNSVPGAPSFNCLAFDRDGDPTTFSVVEQAFITEVWSRVAEDYAPFNVDVTTESPPVPFSSTVAWALITPDRDATGLKCPHFGAGGIAFVNVFGDPAYATFSPAWVWAGDTSDPIPASNVAEAASHEVGHNMGLSHDGRAADPAPYGNNGYAIGFAAVAGVAPSWGPIMGAPYGRDLTQWSKGDYDGGNNHEDDLAIIAAKLGLRPDTHGHSAGTASPLTIAGAGSFAQTGIIARTDEPDFYAVTWPTTANFEAHAEPFRAASDTAGGNLDIRLQLLNADGSNLAIPLSADDPDALGASLSRASLPSGNYLLVVSPAGKGTPLAASPNGYTSYGVLGFYRLTGVPGPTLAVFDASAGALGSVQVGASAIRTISFLNAGTSGSLTLTSFTPSLAAPFALSGVPATLPTLAPGQAVSCQVRFTPTAAGATSTSLTVDSDVGGSVTAVVSGTGTVPPAPSAPPPSHSDSGGGGGGGCGAGSGLAVVLSLLVLRLLGQRLARPVR